MNGFNDEGHPEIFLTHTGNLIPLFDRVCGTLIIKKIQILEITTKTIFLVENLRFETSL